MTISRGPSRCLDILLITVIMFQTGSRIYDNYQRHRSILAAVDDRKEHLLGRKLKMRSQIDGRKISNLDEIDFMNLERTYTLREERCEAIEMFKLNKN